MFRERLDIDPLDWQAQRIARALNTMRVTCNWQDARHPASAIKKIENAIVELSVELPSLIEFEREHISHGSNPGYLIEYRLANVEVFEGLLAAARRAREVVTKQPHKVREAPWHSDALWIASFVSMVGTRAMNFRKTESQEVLLIEDLLRLANINVSNDAIAICFRRRKAKVPRIAYIAPEQL